MTHSFEAKPALRRWLSSGLHVSLLVGQVVWAYLVWFNVADPFSLDAVLLLFYSLSLFGTVGAGIAVMGWLAGRILPRLNANGTRAALVVAVWVGYASVAQVLVRGVYYSDWGVDSIYAAMAIYVLHYGVAALVTIGIALAVAYMRSTLFATPVIRRWVFGAVLVCFPILVGLVGVFSWKVRPDSSGGTSVSSFSTADEGGSIAIIAFDGMTWTVLDELIEGGLAPSFRQLKENGTSARLNTLPIGNSPEIWNTIATGTDPRVHGVNGHVSFRFRLMEQRYFFPHFTGFNFFISRSLASIGLIERQPPGSTDRRTPAFWNLASERGKRTVLINWFGTWPAEEIQGINATSGFFSALGVGRTGKTHRMRSKSVPADATVAYADAESHVKPRDFLRDAIAVRERTSGNLSFHLGLAERALQRIPDPDIFAIYSSQPDGVQHRHWDSWEPDKYFGAAARGAARGSDVIRRTYIELDEYLGKILALLPSEMAVMIISDHGAEAVFARLGQPGGHSNGPPGVFILRGPGIRKNHEIFNAHVNDLMPTICYISGLSVARDWAGRVLLEAFGDDSRRSPTFVDSYGFRSPEARLSEAAPDPEVLEKRMEELRALGYIR